MVTTVLVIAFLAFWFVALRPITLGGTANYTVIHGNSMWPLYHDGDLIITHQQSAYSVGQVVAYRVPDGEIGAGDVVIHRITGGDTTTGLILQGDNNPHTDPWHPRLSNIVGSTWVQIGRGGRVLVLLHQPLALAMLVTVPTVAWIVLRKPRKPGGAPAVASTTAASA
jgi:signal peptidase